MAFLCPVRIRRNKKKYESDLVSGAVNSRQFQPMGRITGSASIETLVRVGIEKENGLSPDSKMVVLHDFTPCVDDELKVHRGQIVNVLYQENDWVYVISEAQQQEGFIPFSYCAPIEPPITYKKKMPRSGPSSMVSSGFQEMPTDAMTDDNELLKLNNHQAMNAPDMLVGIPRHNNFELTYRSHYSPNLFANESASQKNYHADVVPQSHVGLGSLVGPSTMNLAGSNGHSLSFKSSLFGAAQQGYRASTRTAANANHIKRFEMSREDRYKSPSSSVLRNLDMYFTNAYNRVPSNIKEPISSGGSQPFIKHNIGSFIVLFPFYACNEDDVDVEKGEMVTVLNKDDPNWSWIIKKDSSEGFVPALFMCPIEILLNARNRGMLMPKVPTMAATEKPQNRIGLAGLKNSLPKVLGNSYGATVSSYKSKASQFLSNSLKY